MVGAPSEARAQTLTAGSDVHPHRTASTVAFDPKYDDSIDDAVALRSTTGTSLAAAFLGQRWALGRRARLSSVVPVNDSTLDAEDSDDAAADDIDMGTNLTAMSFAGKLKRKSVPQRSRAPSLARSVTSGLQRIRAGTSGMPLTIVSVHNEDDYSTSSKFMMHLPRALQQLSAGWTQHGA